MPVTLVVKAFIFVGSSYGVCRRCNVLVVVFMVKSNNNVVCVSVIRDRCLGTSVAGCCFGVRLRVVGAW